MNNSPASSSTEVAPTSGVAAAPSNVHDCKNQISEEGNEIAIPIPGESKATPTTAETVDDRSLETQFNEHHHTAEAGNEIAIPIPEDGKATQTATESEDDQPPETQFNEHHQTAEAGNEIAIPIPGESKATPTTDESEDDQPPETQFNEHHQTAEGKGTYNVELMDKAAYDGDWAAAEKLLKEDPTRTLASLLREGSRPLHIAVALKHDNFVRKLISLMTPEQLGLEDSDGLTACCYACTSENINIAQKMIQKNPKLLQNYVHLASAIISRTRRVVLHFLDQTAGDCLSPVDWLFLLQTAIANKMNDVALKILKKHDSLATMTGDFDDDNNVTALHVLARQDMSETTTRKMAILFESIFGTSLKGEGKMQPDFRSLATKLLAEIKKKDHLSALELLRKRPILHDAAKVGNTDLIVMLAKAYPELISDKDEDKCSLFQLAIKKREVKVFALVQQLGAFKFSTMFVTDYENENNALHLAAYLGPGKNSIPVLQMQSELAWFKEVEALLPPWLRESKNNDKLTPRELFSQEHEKLWKESKDWMKSTADSCMLIATIIFTVVYAAAFTVPGGTNEQTGLPILMNAKWLTCFFIFEALALFSSTLCIITFWTIATSGLEQDRFYKILPYQLRLGFSSLFGSLIGAISAFMSAYHLVLVAGRAWLVKSILLLIYAILILAIYGRFRELWLKIDVPKSLPRMLKVQKK